VIHRQIGVLQQRIGVSSALSAFAVNKYQGDNEKIAEKIYRYRELLVQQADVEYDAPPLPPFFETPTATRILLLLRIAHRGRITLIAGGPGNSKTESLRHYQSTVSNVFIATLAPSSAGVTTMSIEVLEALGEPDAKGTPQALSRRIKNRLRGSNALLILDDAQHATEKALEELRAWHDATGVGICLVGNQDVLLRLEHGTRKEAFARLDSRVAQKFIFNVASEGDAAVFCDAWGVTDEKSRRFLTAGCLVEPLDPAAFAVSALAKIRAALTARPWRGDAAAMLLIWLVFAGTAMLAWSLQVPR